MMAKHGNNERGQNEVRDDEQVKDSNELLALIRRQMAERRSGPQEERPKDLEILDAD